MSRLLLGPGGVDDERLRGVAWSLDPKTQLLALKGGQSSNEDLRPARGTKHDLVHAGQRSRAIPPQQRKCSVLRVGVHALVLVLALAGCKTTHVLDAASHTDAASAAQIETHEVKSEGPEHIVMTVEEYSQLCDPKEVAPTAQPQVILNQPQILRRTVTVTDRGPSLDDLRTISSLQSKLNQTTTVKTKDLREFLSGLWPWLLGAFGAAALALLKPSWLGAALAALKAVWNVAKSLFGRKAS